jgi:hypothetical protein
MAEGADIEFRLSRGMVWIKRQFDLGSSDGAGDIRAILRLGRNAGCVE